MKKTIHLVAGARPNFMKIAPIVRALQARPEAFDFRIVHTGQHYDHEMSDVFFEELGIPKPDFHLEAGGGRHAQQTAKIMEAYEGIDWLATDTIGDWACGHGARMMPSREVLQSFAYAPPMNPKARPPRSTSGKVLV